MRTSHAILVLLGASLLAGCGGAAEGDHGEVLALRDGHRLVGLDTRSGERRFALPAGLASADGRRYLSAASREGRTTLASFDARNGRRLATRTLAGAWRLGAVSADGRIAALAGDRRGELAVVEPGRPLRRIRLDGDYAVDAVSSDGRSLFLIERLGGERYAVRLYDLAAGRLHDGSIRPKNEDEEMVGVAGAQVGTRDGQWLLTLYVNTAEHEAFVHALNLRDRYALCLDLPSDGASLAALRGYALAVPRSGAKVYAANAELGVAAEVDLRQLGEVGALPLATRAHARPSDAAVSRDGRMLWVAAGRTLQGLDTAALRAVGPRRLAAPVSALAFGADGDLYAFAGGTVSRLDAVTGRPAAA